ncbi:hypothetical protein AAHC03_05780 [Spirometra sp. Aus1]
MRIADKFETIQLQLQNFRLLASDISLPLAPQQSKCQIRHLTTHPPKNEIKQKAQLHKIYLGCLPQSANELKLYEYFSKFGVVDKVSVSKGHQTDRSGNVVFRDLKSAKRVLEFQPHLLDGTQIIVARTMKALAQLVRSKNEMKQKAQLNKIYLGCLPQSVNRLKLYEYFSKFGVVDKVSVSKGPQTDRSGYVVFRDLKSAKKALESQLHELDETKIVVAHDRKALAELIRSMNNNNKMDRNAKPNKIFLGCLPNSANEHNLYEYFSKFGAVNEVYVSKAPSSRGCGYVVFRYQYSAEAVLESRPHHLNDTQIIVARVMKTLSSRIRSKENLNQGRIYFGPLPESAKECDLREYFSKFGTVKAVGFLTGRKSHGCAFVAFRDPESVSTVLNSRPHKINETQIAVVRTKKALSFGIGLLTRLQLPSNTSQALPATSLPSASDATEAPERSFSSVNSSSNQPVTT